MIVGVGTDIVSVARMRGLLERHGDRVVQRILAPEEMPAVMAPATAATLLARRFAAKEAFGKALGTGVRWPATLRQIAVAHDSLGRPVLRYGRELAGLMAQRGYVAHLSISDENEFAVAVVIIEQRDVYG